MFEAFKATERPTFVKFANGREEAIPDLTPMMKPTPLGDIAAYTLFSLGGLFVGGEVGVLTGGWQAKRTISADPAMKQYVKWLTSRVKLTHFWRVETAFKNFRM